MARAQVLSEQMQITLRGRDLRVTQHHGESHDVAALAQVVNVQQFDLCPCGSRRRASTADA